MLPSRYWPFAACLLLTLASGVAVPFTPLAWWGLAVFGGFSLLGLWDLLQRKQALRRNYPLSSHFRYGLESIGPEIRQYFIESDTHEAPFSRQQRAIVYQRAKDVLDKRPFGTQRDVYGDDYEWINHSLQTAKIDSHDFRIPVGEQREKPYLASVFNISAMSFGSLS